MELLAWLPILAALGQAILTIVSVIAGAAGSHLESYKPFPYPSDLLEMQPERGIFALSLTLPAVSTFAVLLVRYLQISEFNMVPSNYLNIASFVLGVIMIIGQNMVAAYSVCDSAAVHFLGASFYFLCGAVYMITQTHLSRKNRTFHKRFIIKLRLALTIIACICPFTYTVGRFALPKEDNRYYFPHISEWVLATCLLTFIGTFTSEFKTIRFTVSSYEEIDSGSVSKDHQTRVQAASECL